MFHYETRMKLAVTCAVTALFLAHPVMAQNYRSWVSNGGKDQNDCTIDHPCKTFQRAHDQTFDAGEVDVLDPGDYGTLKVNRSITIDGGNMGYIACPGFCSAITINAATSRVTVRNLSIFNPAELPTGWESYGIEWTTGSALSVENVSIDGVQAGIYVAAQVALTSQAVTPRLLRVNNTSIRDFTLYGINIVGVQTTDIHTYPVSAVVDHAVIESEKSVCCNGETIGIYATAGQIEVARSVISGVGSGVWVDGNAEANVEDSTIVYSLASSGEFVGKPAISEASCREEAVQLAAGRVDRALLFLGAVVE